jgi:hypothetical protein
MTEAYPICSEECEPFAAMAIGRMWARAQNVKQDADLYAEAMRCFWWTIVQLDRLSILFGTATHFSIAMNNHRGQVTQMIKKDFGINPEDEPSWKWT